jgi:hypothetical protein
MTQDATTNPGPHHEPPSSTAIRFRLLGEFAITVQGERVSPPPHRTKGLLAALLLYPHPQRCARLAGMLSPDVPEHKGQHNLCRAPLLLPLLEITARPAPLANQG